MVSSPFKNQLLQSHQFLSSNLGFLVCLSSILKMLVLPSWLGCVTRDGDSRETASPPGNCRVQEPQMRTEAEGLPLTTGTRCLSSSRPAWFRELLICTQCSVLCWETAGRNQFRSLQTDWASEMIQVTGPDCSLCVFLYLALSPRLNKCHLLFVLLLIVMRMTNNRAKEHIFSVSWSICESTVWESGVKSCWWGQGR